MAFKEADMAFKEKAIARTTPPGTPAGRYQPPDELLAFLSQL
jgi:integrase/recombinase XerD